MDDEIERFREGCYRLGILLTDDHIAKFSWYNKEIIRWGSRVHLVSRGDRVRIPTRHFLDALWPLHAGMLESGKMVGDVGSGAGLPGIPLAIYLSGIQMVLIESNRKKAGFLGHCIRELGLTQTQVVCNRVESKEVAVRFAGRFDTIIARAVANINQLLDWCPPLVKSEGSLIFYRGPTPERDVEDSRANLEKMGLKYRCVRQVHLKELPISSSIVLIQRGSKNDDSG